MGKAALTSSPAPPAATMNTRKEAANRPFCTPVVASDVRICVVNTYIAPTPVARENVKVSRSSPTHTRGLSAGRLLFGSDTPYYDYRRLQEDIEAARIDAPRKDRITWANAVDLIRRFRPDWTPPRTPPAGIHGRRDRGGQ